MSTPTADSATATATATDTLRDAQVTSDNAVAPELTADELRHAYTVGARSRAMEEHIVRLVARGEVKFAIWGPGEEVHGTATALALSKLVGPDRFGLVPHYRSGSMCSMWCELNGKDDFSLAILRQQFSKDTDGMSRGRQMVYHIDIREMGILPVQSPVGMQLGKAAGYAMGFKMKGVRQRAHHGHRGRRHHRRGRHARRHERRERLAARPSILHRDRQRRRHLHRRPTRAGASRTSASYAEGFGVRLLLLRRPRLLGQVYETTLRLRPLRPGIEQKPGAAATCYDLPRLQRLTAPQRTSPSTSSQARSAHARLR